MDVDLTQRLKTYPDDDLIHQHPRVSSENEFVCLRVSVPLVIERSDELLLSSVSALRPAEQRVLVHV